MARCPVCHSPRIVVIVSRQRRAFCGACGSKWIQEGSLQRAVRAGRAPGSAPGTADGRAFVR